MLFRKRFLFIAALAMVAVATSSCGEQAADEEGDGISAAEIQAREDAYREQLAGKTDSIQCSGVVIPDQDFFDMRVALTFDDGPKLSTTPQVLDILAAHGAKGTFFINGKRVTSDASRAILKRMVDEGHMIGNHSQDHENLKNVSSEELTRQIELTHTIIEEAGATPKFFRFPFGSSSCESAERVRSYGYNITGWHVDSADWCFSSSTGGVGHCAESTFKYVDDAYRDDMVGFVLDQAERKEGGVLLFHDVHPYSVSQLDTVLTRLEEAGFTFTTLDDIATFPLLNGETPPERPFIGTACESDEDCDFHATMGEPFCFQYGAETTYGFCATPCEGYCPDMAGFAPTFCTSLDGATGTCVSKAGETNGQCTTLPGTAAADAERFVGSSSASPAAASVCLPE